MSRSPRIVSPAKLTLIRSMYARTYDFFHCVVHLFLHFPPSGTTDLAARFDSKTNGTGTLPAVCLKGHSAKLPDGLWLSPACSACPFQGTAERPASRHPVPQAER